MKEPMAQTQTRDTKFGIRLTREAQWITFLAALDAPLRPLSRLERLFHKASLLRHPSPGDAPGRLTGSDCHQQEV